MVIFAFFPILRLQVCIWKLELTTNVPFTSTFLLVQPGPKFEVWVTEFSLTPMVISGTKFPPICWQSVCWEETKWGG